MSRIHKILFLLAFIFVAILIPGLFKQNLAYLPYLPAVPANAQALSHTNPETCEQTWMRTAAGSANPAYFIPPGDVAALLECGASYVSLLSAIQPMNYEDASLAVARYPDNPTFWFWLGETERTTAPQAALEVYSRVLQLEPTNGLAWCRLGEYYEKAKQLQTAVDAYLSCCQNGDPSSAGCLGAGRMMVKLGNPRQAIVYYRLSKSDNVQKLADKLESQLGAGK